MSISAPVPLPAGVRARNAEYRAATTAQRTTVDRSIQLDGGRFQDIRCGAATTIAAALMRGPEGARALLEGLRPPARGNAQRSALLDEATRELTSQRHFSTRTVQRLQDLLYEVAESNGMPGMGSDELQTAMQRAGVPMRSLRGTAPAASEGVSNSGHAGAQRLGWRERLEDMLEPGEAVPLYLDNPGSDLGHIVLAGRNPRGGLFIYDSAQDPCLVDDARMDKVLSRAVSVYGDYAAGISASLVR